MTERSKATDHPVATDRRGERMSKREADYVSHPVGGRRCAGCSMFRPPHGCTLVEGSISPAGHCRYWERAK